MNFLWAVSLDFRTQKGQCAHRDTSVYNVIADNISISYLAIYTRPATGKCGKFYSMAHRIYMLSCCVLFGYISSCTVYGFTAIYTPIFSRVTSLALVYRGEIMKYCHDMIRISIQVSRYNYNTIHIIYAIFYIFRFLNSNLRMIQYIVQKRYISSSSSFLYHNTYVDDCITKYCDMWCIVSPNHVFVPTSGIILKDVS